MLYFVIVFLYKNIYDGNVIDNLKNRMLKILIVCITLRRVPDYVVFSHSLLLIGRKDGDAGPPVLGNSGHESSVQDGCARYSDPSATEGKEGNVLFNDASATETHLINLRDD